MLTKKKIKYFEKLLNQRLDELLNEANKTVSGMTADKENLPDPADRASLESNRNFTLRIRDRERKLIGKIKEALERIEVGTYGICEECEEEISEARLIILPLFCRSIIGVITLQTNQVPRILICVKSSHSSTVQAFQGLGSIPKLKAALLIRMSALP